MRFDTLFPYGSTVIVRRWYLLLLLVGMGMAFWYGSATDVLTYPFGPDSSRAIERARILMATGHLPADRLFPPGYPLLIWASSALGLEPAKAALWVVRASYAFLPLVLAWGLGCVTGARSAVTIAALVALSPGLWYIGSKAGSDMPFLLLIIGGVALLLRSAGSTNLLQALFAGVLLGAAYVMRNAGIAAFAAVGTALGIGTFLRWLPHGSALRITVAFTVGAALMVSPLLLWHYIEFGHLQPYAMPPSNIGLVTNIRIFVEQSVLDLVASNRVAKYMAWDYWLLLGAGIAFAVLLTAGIRSHWSALSNREKFALALLASYVAAGASMVVLARTLYQWGEYINLRHVVQYSWAVYPAAALLIDLRPQSAPGKPAIVVAAVAVTVGALIAARVVWLFSEYRDNKAMHEALASTTDPASAIKRFDNKHWIWTGALKRQVADDRNLMMDIENIPPNTIIASNMPDVLRIETTRTIRTLEFDSANQLRDQLLKVRYVNGHPSPVDALILPTNDLLRKDQWRAIIDLTFPGYKSATDGPDVLWLRSDAQP